MAGAALECFGSCCWTDIWLGRRVHAVVLAGLQRLDEGAVRGAAIDGTTTWRVFRFHDLAMLLAGDSLLCVVIRAIEPFRNSTSCWTLTGGGPWPLDRIVACLLRARPSQPRSRPAGRQAAIMAGLIILVLARGARRLVDRIAKA